MGGANRSQTINVLIRGVNLPGFRYLMTGVGGQVTGENNSHVSHFRH